MADVAVVILNWNGRKLLEEFLPSVVGHTFGYGRIVLADNGSTDDSLSYIVAHYPTIEIVRLPQNYGFAGGYNRALEQVDAEYFVLLNSDIEVTQGWLTPLIEYMENTPDAAACMPKILSYKNKQQFEYAGAAGGFIDRYGYPFCRGRILNTIEYDNEQYNNVQDIFWASGACMVVKASVFKEVNGFDEAFFAHMEEIDLCWRIKRLNYSIACIPQATVYHLGGGTLDYSSPNKVYLNHRNNLYMLYKNLPKRGFKRTLFKRMVLDGLSGLSYLLSLNFKAFKALIKAHSAFRKQKPQLKVQRAALQKNAKTEKISGIYRHFIIWQYYKSRRKLKFSDLKFGVLNEKI